ncbi:MBOAT family protein [Mangrovimonas sp. AS39]|uniref:MBOAT family O-acyltransferase n=1 Tax=Mangrovimonas futianensis TaxID=2895523 RepID=UPI001E3BBF27|nr:MBOAT family protein [Mangrovimonas futianensis]MCF1190796.1 MBOAT family protein [Mangrovimonas futianensis]MCF1194493.1 MBOAT family protein [Mangrovimonas futianensis]
MIFNSFEFALFLPIVFFIYWYVLDKNYKAQNVFLVVASYVFYGWWDYRFLSLIIFSTFVDYYVGKRIYKENNVNKRRFLLGISLVLNLGFLGFFKYFNFFIDSFLTTFRFFGYSFESPLLKIILPVGISFYTFQTLSYTIDIYRGRLKPTNDFVVFAAFVSFFPQLVAGPIERASNLISQFDKERRLKFINIQFGFIRILWGLFKKVVIADRLAPIVNRVFESPESYHGTEIIVAMIFFAFQIYCDFSGYSDIAIGTARMFGFRLMENFRMPYFSKSIGEFWRNWHISLSTWFRDYVYIPLGGNRVSKKKWMFNIMLTFVVSGLWHGAAWTFVIWGAIHGFILIFEGLVIDKTNHVNWFGLLKQYIQTVLTFSIVCCAWVFFRAESFNDALLIFSNLTDFSNSIAVNIRNMELYIGLPLWNFISVFGLILLLCLIEFLIKRKVINEFIIIKKKLPYRWTLYTFLILTILVFGVFEIDEFIYFQF